MHRMPSVLPLIASMLDLTPYQRRILSQMSREPREKTPQDLEKLAAAEAKRKRRAEKRNKLNGLKATGIVVDDPSWMCGYMTEGDVHFHKSREEAQACMDGELE